MEARKRDKERGIQRERGEERWETEREIRREGTEREEGRVFFAITNKCSW